MPGWQIGFSLSAKLFQPQAAGLAAQKAAQRVGNPIIYFHRPAGDVKLVNFVRGAVKAGDESGPEIGVLPAQLDKKAGKKKAEKTVFPQMNKLIAPREPQGREGGAFYGGKTENQKGVAEGRKVERKGFFHRQEYREFTQKGLLKPEKPRILLG